MHGLYFSVRFPRSITFSIPIAVSYNAKGMMKKMCRIYLNSFMENNNSTVAKTIYNKIIQVNFHLIFFSLLCYLDQYHFIKINTD